MRTRSLWLLTASSALGLTLTLACGGEDTSSETATGGTGGTSTGGTGGASTGGTGGTSAGGTGGTSTGGTGGTATGGTGGTATGGTAGSAATGGTAGTGTGGTAGSAGTAGTAGAGTGGTAGSAGSGGATGGTGGTTGGTGGTTGGTGGTTGGTGGTTGGTGGTTGGTGGTTGGTGGTTGGTGGTTGGTGGTGGSTGGTGGATGGTGGGFSEPFGYGPTISSRQSNSLDVIGVTAAGNQYVRSWLGNGWSNWAQVPGAGVLKSDIDSVSWSADRIDIAARGTTDAIYHQAWHTGTGWEAIWFNESSGITWKYSPATASPANNRLWLFATGQDDAVWSQFWNGAGWSGWTSIPTGLIKSAPDAFARTNGNVYDNYLVGLGMNNQVWFNRRQWVIVNGTGAWGGWGQLPALQGGGTFDSGPTICSWEPGRLDVFVRGTATHEVWHNWSNDSGANWSTNWENLGGQITSDPDCVSWGPDRIDVVAKGTDDGVWRNAYLGNTWAGWSSLGAP